MPTRTATSTPRWPPPTAGPAGISEEDALAKLLELNLPRAAAAAGEAAELDLADEDE